MMPRCGARREEGFSLVEITVTAGVLALLVLATATSVRRAPAHLEAAHRAFVARVADARAYALATGGATLVVAPAGGGAVVSLFGGRPEAGTPPLVAAGGEPPTTLAAAVDAEIDGAPSSAFALFFGASGRVAAAAGFDPHAGTTLTTEPPCATGSVAIVLASANEAISVNVDCASGSVR